MGKIVPQLEEPLLAHRRSKIGRFLRDAKPFRRLNNLPAGGRTREVGEVSEAIVISKEWQEDIQDNIGQPIASHKSGLPRQNFASQIKMTLPKRVPQSQEALAKGGQILLSDRRFEERQQAGDPREGSHSPMRMIGGTEGGEFPALQWEDQPGLALPQAPPGFPEPSEVDPRLVIDRFKLPRIQKASQPEEQSLPFLRASPFPPRPLGNEQKRNFIVLVAESGGEALKKRLPVPTEKDRPSGGLMFPEKTESGGRLDQPRRFFGFQRRSGASGRRRRLSQGYGGQTDLDHGAMPCRAGEEPAFGPPQEKMQNHVFVSRVLRMPMVFPVAGFRIELDVADHRLAVDQYPRTAKIRAGFPIPDAEILDLNLLAVLPLPCSPKFPVKEPGLQLQLTATEGRRCFLRSTGLQGFESLLIGVDILHGLWAGDGEGVGVGGGGKIFW